MRRGGAQALLTIPADAVAGLAGKSADLAAAAFRTAALAKLSVPLGILSGLIAGNFYNRFGAIKLPDYLAFFGGRRFVPIVSGVAGVGRAAVFGAAGRRSAVPSMRSAPPSSTPGRSGCSLTGC